MSSMGALIVDSIFYKTPSIEILKGVYLKLNNGTITGLFGRNGSRKSTLLKIIAGQLNPSQGIIKINGEKFYNSYPDNRFKDIAYLSQETMLPTSFKVGDLIDSFPSKSLVLKSDVVLKKVLQSKVSDLSVEIRRYLEIKLILSLERKYFLLDEPYTGLSPLFIEKVNSDLKRLSSEGKGILIADHYHHYLIAMIDHAYLLINRNSYRLDSGEDFKTQLRNYNYLGQSAKV